MVDGMRSESSVYDLDVPAQVVVAGRSVALTDTEQDVPVVGDRKLEADHLLVELAGSGIVGYRYQYAGAFGQLRIKRCLILFVKTIEEEGSDIESPEIGRRDPEGRGFCCPIWSPGQSLARRRGAAG